MIEHGHNCTGNPCTCAAKAISPDCRDGNHQKCDGIAWDMAADEATSCKCGCDHYGIGPQ